jgi:hypothetical protein
MARARASAGPATSGSAPDDQSRSAARSPPQALEAATAHETAARPRRDQEIKDRPPGARRRRGGQAQGPGHVAGVHGQVGQGCHRTGTGGHECPFGIGAKDRNDLGHRPLSEPARRLHRVGVEPARQYGAGQEPRHADTEGTDEVGRDIPHGPLGAEALRRPLLLAEPFEHVGRPAAFRRDQRENLAAVHGADGSARPGAYAERHRPRKNGGLRADVRRCRRP